MIYIIAFIFFVLLQKVNIAGEKFLTLLIDSMILEPVLEELFHRLKLELLR